MARSKERIERVDPGMARLAVYRATSRGKVWTEYILVHFRQTGNLAPGCDARDLYAWLEVHEPDRLAAITKR